MDAGCFCRACDDDADELEVAAGAAAVAADALVATAPSTITVVAPATSRFDVDGRACGSPLSSAVVVAGLDHLLAVRRKPR